MALQEVEVSTILLISLKFYILRLTGVIWKSFLNMKIKIRSYLGLVFQDFL